MRRNTLLLVTMVALLLAGCAYSKMSVTQRSGVAAKAIQRLAIVPGSGILGDAIGLELFNMGVHVVDADETATIVGRAGMDEIEVTSIEGYAVLREKGLDAVLTAKAVMAADGRPESASVRVTDTATGDLLAGITWQNGWGESGDLLPTGQCVRTSLRRLRTSHAN